jgi:hypothetical protein
MEENQKNQKKKKITNNQKRNFFQDACCGYIGSAFGIFVTHPLDTLKTNIQLSKNNETTFQIARHIYNRPQGIFSFYAGVIPPIFFRSIGFGVNQFVFTYLKKNDISSMVSGAGAGMAMVVADNPALVVKIRVQGEKLKIKENIFPYLRAMRDIGEKESIQGLYSGFCARIILQGVGFGVFYVFYDYFVFEKNWSSFSAGCFGVVPSWFCCYPFEGIFSRQAMNSDKSLNKYFSLTNEVKRLQFKNSFRGISVCISRAIPQFGIMMSVTEKLKTFID